MNFSAQDLSVQVIEYADGADQVRTTLRLENQGKTSLADRWRLYFSLGLAPSPEDKRVNRVLVDGRYGYLEPGPAWEPLEPSASIEIEIENWLFSGMPLIAAQGFHLATWGDTGGNSNREQLLGEPMQLAPALQPLSSLRNRWIATMSPSCDVEPQTLAHVFEKNRRAQETPDSNQPVIIPPALELTINGDPVAISGETSVTSVTIDDSMAAEEYRLAVAPEGISIAAGSERGIFYAQQTLRQLQTDRGIHRVSVHDKPDFEHRALFLDIARHYQGVTQLEKIIRVMAAYKLNRLQLGICNDEGWRLAIPGLPELTEIGARRTFDANDDEGKPRGLFPAWGDGAEETQDFLTAAEFVHLLRFAAEHHVEIIPEFNLPAHANALIRAMAASGRYQVVDTADESQHRSAQGYTRNVVNVCLPDVYSLAGSIIAGLKTYYDQAGVPFSFLHLGGDETPAGAWLHSPVCRAFCSDNGLWEDHWKPEENADAMTNALMAHYAIRILETVAAVSADIRVGFWHEMSPFLPADAIESGRVYVNGWTTEAGDRDLVDAVLDRGQQLVVSNASYLYLDMPYGLHAEEPGLPWAAYIDTEHIFDFDPIGCWQVAGEHLGQVNGIQAQLWAETIYTAELMDYHLLPRLLAVAERAWRRVPEPGRWPAFAHALGERELPYLDSLQLNYRLPPPGAKLIGGEVHTNVVFPGLVIRYSLDGSDPDEYSPVYIEPVPLEPGQTMNIATFSTTGRSSRFVQIRMENSL